MMLRDARRAVVHVYSSDDARSRREPLQAGTHEAFCIYGNVTISVKAITYYVQVVTSTD